VDGFMSVSETAEKWNVTPQCVSGYIRAGRIPGCRKIGNYWAVPDDAVKPAELPRGRRPAGYDVNSAAEILPKEDIDPFSSAPELVISNSDPVTDDAVPAPAPETPDLPRIEHLLRLGIIASLAVLAGDMLLGWGVSYPSVTGIPPMLTRYLSVSDGRIFASALLGLIFIPVECMCWAAVYRMIRPYSEKRAHTYRAGLIGCLAFGGCGVHVPCCMAAYMLKHFFHDDPSSAMRETLHWAVPFLLPATVIILIFFILNQAVQITAFLRQETPLPRRCWVFSVLFGLVFGVLMKLIGDFGLTNALATGWISIGNLWMMSGLLVALKKVKT